LQGLPEIVRRRDGLLRRSHRRFQFPKPFHYIAESGKELDRNFCPICGARVYSSNLESFPGMVFVTIGSLDQPDGIEPKLEMFTKRRLKWAKPLDVPQFPSMPH
jgi:hypothetical protein